MKKYILTFFSILWAISSQAQVTGISLSGSSDDMVQHVVPDSSGNYYVYITFSNQLTLDSAGTPKIYTTTAAEATCIVKYNCKNLFQWAVQVDNTKRFALNGGLKVIPGSIFVAFSFPVATNLIFSDGNRVTLNATGTMASCLLCLSDAGLMRWKNIISSTSGTTELNDLFISGNGSMYIAGGYKGVPNIAGQHGTNQSGPPSMGSTDAFIAKLNTSGDVYWITTGGGNGDDFSSYVTTDLNGNLYASHIFSGNATFGTYNVSTVAQWGSAWSRINQTDGSFTWVNATTAPSGTGGGIVTDDAGNIYFLGSFQGIKTFPSKSSGYHPTITSVGGYDLYIAKYKSDGNIIWVKKYGGSGDEFSSRSLIRNNKIFTHINYDANFTSGTVSFPHAGVEDDALVSIDTSGSIQGAQFLTGAGSKRSICVAFSNTGKLYIGGTYNGTVSSASATMNSSSAYDGYIFIFDSLPAAQIIHQRTQTVCNRKSVQIFTGPEQGTFEWSPGAFFNDSNAADPILIAPVAGKYYLKYTTPGGCVYYDTLNINITFCSIACTDCDSNKDINKNILMCLPFSGDAADESLHGYNGTTNNVTGAPDRYGRNGYAYAFNGTNSYINITKPIPDLTTATLSLWVKAGTNTGGSYGKMIVWEGNNNCNNNYFLSIKDSTLYFGASKQGKQLNGTVGSGLVSLTSSLGKNWNHLVWVLEPTQSNIYLNGVLLTTLNRTGSLSGNHYDFTIGAMNDGGGGACGAALSNFYNGLIDDVRLYNKALNSNEVSYLYDPLDTITVGTDLTICKGDSAFLGVPPAGHKWKYTVLSGDMGSLMLPNKVRPAISSAYLLKDTTNTCTRYDTIFVEVRTIPGMNAGNDTTICEGDTLQLNATGPSAPKWTPALGISDPNILNPKVYPSNSTPYVLTMFANSCSVQDTIYITVDHKPAINLGGQLALCKKDSIMLNAPSGYQYLWTPFRKITNPRIYNPTVFPDSNLTYFLTLTSGACTLKDSVKIVVQNSLPTKTVVKTICLGDSFQMVSTGAVSYQWSPGTTLNDSTRSNPNCSPAINTRYLCNKISSSGCTGTDTFYISVDPSIIIPNATPDTTICAGQSLQLSASGGVNYIWSPGNLVNDSTSSNPTGAFENSTTLVVAVTGAKGCTRFDTVQITVNPIAITACPDPVACNNLDSIQLWAVGCDSYKWTPNIGLNSDTVPDPKVLPAGIQNIYIVTGKVANGCTRSDTVLIRFTKVQADAGPDKDVCGIDSVQLQGSGGFSYQWVPSNGLSNPNIPNPMAYPASDGYYMLIATDSFGCSDPDSIYLTMKPKAIVYTDSLHTICRGQEIGLVASGDGGYEWSTGNLDSMILVSPPRDTFYYVLSKPSGYCPSDTAFTSIIVNPMPKAGFKAKPEWGLKPMNVQFYDESRGALQYRWYFGTGDTDTVASPSYTYMQHGHYMVRQLVTNQYSCTDSARFEIIVFDSFYMYIPNTFTPNNNKKNDLLTLDYDPENMLQGNIQIFNRWGEMVYEADLKNYIPWDGTFHGKPVPSDAYVLVWYVTDLSRGEHHNAMILHVFR